MTDPARDFLEAGADLIPHKPEAATMRELEDLFLIVDAAREKFGEAIKATSEKTGYSSPAIRKAVRATVKDRIGEAAREVLEVAELLNLEPGDGHGRKWRD